MKKDTRFPLNLEQTTAVNGFITGAPGIYTLTGKAGTGKTAVIKEIYRQMRGTVVLTGTTNKACANLAVIDGKDVVVKTIDSHLGILLDNVINVYGEKDSTITANKQKKDKSDSNTLLIIDESSMMTADKYQMLLDRGTKVLMVGDEGQLPPVSGEYVFRDSILNNTQYTHFVLNTVYRQEKGSLIDYTASIYKKKAFPKISSEKHAFLNFVDGSKVGMVLNQYEGGAQIIAPTNQTADYFNSIIAGYYNNKRKEKMVGVSQWIKGNPIPVYHDTPLIYIGHKSTRLIKNQIYKTVVPMAGSVFNYNGADDAKMQADIDSINKDNTELFDSFYNIITKVKTSKNRVKLEELSELMQYRIKKAVEHDEVTLLAEMVDRSELLRTVADGHYWKHLALSYEYDSKRELKMLPGRINRLKQLMVDEVKTGIDNEDTIKALEAKIKFTQRQLSFLKTNIEGILDGSIKWYQDPQRLQLVSSRMENVLRTLVIEESNPFISPPMDLDDILMNPFGREVEYYKLLTSQYNIPRVYSYERKHKGGFSYLYYKSFTNTFNLVSMVTSGSDKQVLVDYDEIQRDFESAAAITIHKSQGSQYPHVVIPLLYGGDVFMWDAAENLRYTALTRSEDKVTIVYTKETKYEI